MRISGNDLLSNIDGLKALASVETLVIEADPAVTSLAALSQLKRARGVTLTGTGLVNLAGLENAQISGDLDVSSNSQLKSLTGLGSGNRQLTTLRIAGNARLTDITGLAPLHTVQNYLFMSGNPLLASLAGLEQLTSVPTLLVQSNALLTSIAGLQSLKSVTTQLSITGNASLPVCQVLALLERIGPGPSLRETTGNNENGACN